MAREDQEALGSFLLVFSSIPLSGPAVYLDLKETSKLDLLISPVMDWPSVHSVSLTKTLGLALVSLQLLRILEKGWICLLLQCVVLLLSFRHKTARYSQYSKPESYYGVNFVPIFIKQIQCFANSKLNLRENVEVWTNICIVCYNCDTHLPFYVETWLDFLTCNWATFFSKNSRWRVSIYASLPKHLFTSSEQCEWEQVSFCLTISIIIHLDVFTKRP